LPPRPARQEHVPYVQPVNKVLLQRLEQAGQPVPATAAFLQDSLAVVVIERLLDQIEIMKRHCITALEHIKHAGKRKALVYKEPVVEPKWARAPVRQPQEFMQAPAPTVVQPPLPHVQPPSSFSISIPVCPDPVVPHPIQEPDIPAVVENPLAELSLEPYGEIMADAPAMQQGWRVEVPYAPVRGSQAGLSSQGEAHLAPKIPELKAQPVAAESHGLSASLHALDPPLDLSKLDVMDFPNNVPARASPAQLLFMHAVSIPAPAPQFPVVILTTDSRTPEQYGEFIVTQQKTVATSKGKRKAVAMIEDESNYGQSSSEDEQESEEGESAAQHFHNTVHVGADANWAAAFKFYSHQWAKVPATIVYKYTLRGLPRTPYELFQLYKYYANEHVSHHNRVVAYMLISELLQFAQRLDDNLHDCTMQDLKNPIQGPEDMDLVEQRHIPTCFLHVKEDGTLVLHVMHALDPSHPFNLEQVVQYTLISGQPGLENTWQGITFDFAFYMHWRTLFGFALCQALCTNSTAKSTVVRRLALVMVHSGMYHEAVASYNVAFLDRPLVAQYGSHLNILQVHVPDDQAHNFLDNNALHVLLHNCIPLDWVNHAYTYGMVYLEQQFHSPTMSLAIFREVDDEHIERLSCYSTPPAIPHWDGWREMMEDDHYRLMFKHNE
ncbi:hypothetical protein C0995_008247, partial [Termitomyces sp. Mi166